MWSGTLGLFKKKYDTDFAPKRELRQKKVKELKITVVRTADISHTTDLKAKAATETSFWARHIIIKHKTSILPR